MNIVSILGTVILELIGLLLLLALWAGAIFLVKNGIPSTESILDKHKNLFTFFPTILSGIILHFTLIQPKIEEQARSNKNNQENLTPIDTTTYQYPSNQYWVPFTEERRVNNNHYLVGGLMRNPNYLYTNETNISGYRIGHFHLEEIPLGVSSIINLKKCIRDFHNKSSSNYNLKTTIDIFGQADGVPTSGRVYDGAFGSPLILDYVDGDTKELRTDTLYAGITILENRHYALLRAYSVLENLTYRGEHLNFNYRLFTRTTPLVGGSLRCVLIQAVIENAYPESTGVVPPKL